MKVETCEAEKAQLVPTRDLSTGKLLATFAEDISVSP